MVVNKKDSEAYLTACIKSLLSITHHEDNEQLVLSHLEAIEGQTSKIPLSLDKLLHDFLLFISKQSSLFENPMSCKIVYKIFKIFVGYKKTRALLVKFSLFS